MKKKLGPLEVWQWAAIGAIAGLALYLYRRHQQQLPAVNPPLDTTSATGLGPIDPSTGEPYSLEAAAGNQPNLGQELQDLAAIQGLGQAANPGNQIQGELQDLSSIVGLMEAIGQQQPGPASDTSPQTVAQHTGAKPAPAYHALPGPIVGKGGGYRKIPGTNLYLGAGGKVKTAKQAGIANPGHVQVNHPGGKKHATATAPHNHRQHSNAAAPQHQRASTPHRSAPSRVTRRSEPRRGGRHRRL